MAKPAQVKTVQFDYIKSNSFRDIHVDGAFGGVGPVGTFIHMAVYSERFPIPQQTIYALTKTGELDQEIPEERTGRAGILRTMEANLILDYQSAKRLHDWLGDKIKNLEQVEKKKIDVLKKGEGK